MINENFVFISNDFLSYLLDMNCEFIKVFDNKLKYVYEDYSKYREKSVFSGEINCIELAQKRKDLAFKNNNYIISGYNIDNKNSSKNEIAKAKIKTIKNNKIEESEYFYGDTEMLAILKARYFLYLNKV